MPVQKTFSPDCYTNGLYTHKIYDKCFHSKILALRFRKEKIAIRECAKAFADSWRRLRVREEASRIREEALRIREDALRIREDDLRFCKGLCGCVKYQEGSSLRMRKDNSTLRIRKEKISTLRMRKVKICLWKENHLWNGFNAHSAQCDFKFSDIGHYAD